MTNITYAIKLAHHKASTINHYHDSFNAPKAPILAPLPVGYASNAAEVNRFWK